MSCGAAAEWPQSAGAREEFGFLLVPGFSMMAFASAVEPLRAANRLSGADLYSWKLISADGARVQASNGIEILPDHGILEAAPPGIIVICAGLDAHRFDDRRTLDWLRCAAKRKAQIGALSTGTWVLAKAGLLGDRRCTTHWEELPSLSEAHPELDLTGNLFEIDQDRFTCSGGTAALDLMLHLIALRHGHDLAVAVSEQFIHTSVRDGEHSQRMTLRQRLQIAHPRLLAAVALMESRLEKPLAPAQIAAGVGISTRQLERLFGKYLARTPMQYYLRMRLERAHRLLSHTSLSIMEIAIACGFISASSFTHAFHAHFDLSPRQARLLPSRPGTPRAAAAGREPRSRTASEHTI